MSRNPSDAVTKAWARLIRAREHIARVRSRTT